MIKVKVNNEYKDVVKIFGGGTLQKEIIKIWSREAQEYVYVYESSVEYTGPLPITISTNGDALIDYQIYGASGGVGKPTESGEPVGYKLPLTVTVSDGNTAQTVSVYIGGTPLEEEAYVNFGEQKVYRRTENIFNGRIEKGYYAFANGQKDTASDVAQHWVCTTLMSCNGNTAYGIRAELSTELKSRSYGIVWFNSSLNFISSNSFNMLANPVNFDVMSPPSAAYYTVDIAGTYVNTPMSPNNITNITIVEGSTPPSTYIPYLQPTDPPVPLPEIPTIKGETVIDYDGDPKPSQMYVKYKDKR